MYHVTVGHQITNLRLSGETIMKIFTGAITNWDDPAITKDYGAQLPNEPIIPVVRSDGSGATFFFTRWMAHEFPQQWDAFCQKVHPGIKLPCPQTEFYPQFGNVKLESGSNAVSVYITSSYGEGAIGYDEYAYALNAHWPVVSVENAAGYYVLPRPPTWPSRSPRRRSTRIRPARTSCSRTWTTFTTTTTRAAIRCPATATSSCRPRQVNSRRSSTPRSASRCPRTSTSTCARDSSRLPRSATRRCPSTW